MIRFSIIIPVKAINDYVRETVPKIQAISRGDWELIILPNDADPDEWQDTRIRIVASGRVGPAKKRDMGADIARGEVLVFLDDDSYPEADLLDIASPYFDDQTVVGLGGPAITPPHDSFWQRVSGAVFLSKLSGGAPERYVPVGDVRSVDDWPSVNLMVRRTAFLEVGGFNSPYWPGEDTKLCLDLIKKTGGRILYIPRMRVWHHRRSGLAAHLKQVGGYGIHRGYFAKKHPETSRRLVYFVPSMFFLFFVITILSFSLNDYAKRLIEIGWLIYIIAMLFSIKDISKHENIKVATTAVCYIFLTHLYYGIKFIQGLFTSKLISRLR